MPAEIHQMQTSLTETINHLARGFLTPYATSRPELPCAEHLARVAQHDRAYNNDPLEPGDVAERAAAVVEAVHSSKR
jgi:hypothetical protein